VGVTCACLLSSNFDVLLVVVMVVGGGPGGSVLCSSLCVLAPDPTHTPHSLTSIVYMCLA
jgi:hypothetical protein